MSPYLAALLLAGVVSLVLAVLTWMRRPAPGALPATVLNLVVTAWTLGYLAELLAPTLGEKIFWAKLQYPAIVALAPSLLGFALDYTGRRNWLNNRNLALLALVPVIIVLLVFTNEAHGLIWSHISMGSAADLTTLKLEHGPLFWVVVAYSYVLILLGTYLLLGTARRFFNLYSRQGYSILLALAAPWVGNVMYLTGLNPFQGFDPTILAFAVTGVALSFSLFSFHLFDVVPLARDMVVESMADAVLVLDGSGRVVDLNTAARGLIDRPARQVAGAPLVEVLPAVAALVADAPAVGQMALALVPAGQQQECYFELSVLAVKDRRDVFAGQVLVLRDVTARRQAEDALRLSEARFRMMFYDAPIGMALFAHDYSFAQVNRALCEMLDYSEPELLARTFTAVTHPEDLAQEIELVARFFRGEIPGYSIEIRYLTSSGQMVWAQLAVTMISDNASAPTYGLAMIENVTAQRQARELLREMALTDELTGLANRREIRRQLSDEMQRYGRYGHAFVLVLLDLDHFKDVNDRFGHQVGDLVLQWIGEVLRENLRVADRPARYGGEEFAIIMPETSTEEGFYVAERLRQTVAAHPFSYVDGDKPPLAIPVTMSVGVASSEDAADSEDELISAVDQALYAAKRGGRNRTVLFQAEQRAPRS